MALNGVFNFGANMAHRNLQKSNEGLSLALAKLAAGCRVLSRQPGGLPSIWNFRRWRRKLTVLRKIPSLPALSCLTVQPARSISKSGPVPIHRLMSPLLD